MSIEPRGRFVYGLDPASKSDYFGIVIHKIPNKNPRADTYTPLPELVKLEAVTHTSYLHIMSMLKNELFRKYPPYYIVIDSSNEKTISEVLTRDYGKERVETISFSGSKKQMLKDDGLAVLKQGYRFPNPQTVKNLKQRALLETLLKQLRQEQMLVTAAGNIKFDHPSGEHNDLSTAWELSIHGCLRFTINASDGPAAYGSKKEKRRGWGLDDDVADPTAEIKLNPYNRVLSETTYTPEGSYV